MIRISLYKYHKIKIKKIFFLFTKKLYKGPSVKCGLTLLKL